MQDVAIQNSCPHRVECEEAYAEGSRYIRISEEADTSKEVRVYRAGKDLSNFAFFREPTLLFMDLNNVSLGGPEALLDIGELVTVSYTLKNDYQCPLCAGSGYSDDYAPAESGDLLAMLLEDGLAQMMEKVVSTRLGSNQFHRWYGSEIDTILGEKVVDVQFTKSSIEGIIRDAIGRFADAYTKVWASGASDPGDILKSLDSITVTQDEIEPTTFLATVVYTTGSGKQISYEQAVRLGYYKQAR